jgi:methylase of polypeptide subunit release factors
LRVKVGPASLGGIAIEPFSFLDLGCGDAATLAPVLKGCQVKSYNGVDLSEPALALAVKNLGVLSGPSFSAARQGA